MNEIRSEEYFPIILMFTKYDNLIFSMQNFDVLKNL